MRQYDFLVDVQREPGQPVVRLEQSQPGQFRGRTSGSKAGQRRSFDGVEDPYALRSAPGPTPSRADAWCFHRARVEEVDRGGAELLKVRSQVQAMGLIQPHAFAMRCRVSCRVPGSYAEPARITSSAPVRSTSTSSPATTSSVVPAYWVPGSWSSIA